jgi:Nitrile hydratase, alpha chain
MTEAAGGSGRAELERRLIEKSLRDESLCQRLLADPKAALEEELGTRLPEEVQVRAVEETADTIYLVLPSTTAGFQAGAELSDRELETVAGGEETNWSCGGATCGPTTCQSGQSTCIGC